MTDFTARLSQKHSLPDLTIDILANSGKLMHSGQELDLSKLYVLTREDEPRFIQVTSLEKPDKQTEDYVVKIQKNHDEDVTATVGGARVWIQNNQLYARIKFANTDEGRKFYELRDVNSYSISIDWTDARRERGLLTDISIVYLPDDPRARTVSKNQAKKGDIKMSKEMHELSAEERAVVDEALNKVTAAVDTVAEKPAAEAETKAEAPAVEAKETHAAKQPTFIVVNQQAKETNTATNSSWLKGKEAVDAYGRAIIEARGDKDKFSALWNKTLTDKHAISFNPSTVTVVPELVLQAIHDVMNTDNSIWNAVTHTGFDYYTSAAVTSKDGARGHVVSRTKVEEAIVAKPRTIVPADLYKLIRIEHGLVRRSGGESGNVVRFVLNELVPKLIQSAEQAILVGGVTNDDAGATPFTALAPMIDEDATYLSTYAKQSTDSWRLALSQAASKVKSGMQRYFITSENNFATLENSETTNGSLVFPNGVNKNAPQISGLSGIITPIWLTDEMLGEGVLGLVYDKGAYFTVGNTTPEAFSDFEIDQNQYVHMRELNIGGGLVKPLSAVKVTDGTASA